MQLRDPAENGMNANGDRCSLIIVFSSKRDGSNTSGFGKTRESRCIPLMAILTVVPFRINWSPETETFVYH